MVISWIISIIIPLQVIGFFLAKKRIADTQGFLYFMTRYNVFIGLASFYLVTLLWISIAIPSAIVPNIPYYMISALLVFLGIVFPVKIFIGSKKAEG